MTTARKNIVCLECGAFLMEKGQKRYCSDTCARMAVVKSRSVLSKCEMCGFDFLASKYDIAKGMGKYCSMRCTGHSKSMSRTAPKTHSRSNGGRRPDMGDQYFRSSWEANYARYLNWLISTGGSNIVSWEFEPKVFIFPIKRGNTSYTPDFKINKRDGSYEWHEVKGWMDKVSATKLKRMAKYYPQEPIIVIGKLEYKAIATQVKSFIPGWELSKKHAT